MRPSDSEAQDGVVLRTVILCGGRGLGEIRGEGEGIMGQSGWWRAKRPSQGHTGAKTSKRTRRAPCQKEEA